MVKNVPKTFQTGGAAAEPKSQRYCSVYTRSNLVLEVTGGINYIAQNNSKQFPSIAVEMARNTTLYKQLKYVCLY